MHAAREDQTRGARLADCGDEADAGEDFAAPVEVEKAEVVALGSEYSCGVFTFEVDGRHRDLVVGQRDGQGLGHQAHGRR